MHFGHVLRLGRFLRRSSSGRTNRRAAVQYQSSVFVSCCANQVAWRLAVVILLLLRFSLLHSFAHSFFLSFSLSFFHSFILSFFHSFILSFFHSSFFHFFILSFFHSFILSFFHSFSLSVFQSFSLSVFHSFILSFSALPPFLAVRPRPRCRRC